MSLIKIIFVIFVVVYPYATYYLNTHKNNSERNLSLSLASITYQCWFENDSIFFMQFYFLIGSLYGVCQFSLFASPLSLSLLHTHIPIHMYVNQGKMSKVGRPHLLSLWFQVAHIPT